MRPFAKLRIFPLFLFLILLWPLAAGAAVRLKDIAAVQGVRQNQLVGYGLVVGLNGTGDGSNASFTTQGLINMLENMGVHVSRENIRVRNVAGVMVTAKLPPFVKIGQPIDVTISSLGDASSLQGGTLIATPLKGLDGKIYAMAQGPVSIGGFEVTGGIGAGVQRRHQTVARIPNGATVEGEVPLSFGGREELTLSLHQPDFTTAARVVEAVNGFLQQSAAKALDGATITVAVPNRYRENEIAFLAALEALQVEPDGPAKVVLDERTGTIVMGDGLRIKSLAVSHGNLSLQVAPGAGEPVAGRPGDRLVTLREGTTLGEVVRALNAVGASPRDLIAIFQSIKASGALQAELEII